MDDLGFFDDPSPATGGDGGSGSEATPSPNPASTESGNPASSVDPNYVGQLEERVRAQEKWQQEAARFFSGQQQPAPASQPDPQAAVLAMLQNPQGFRQDLLNEARQAFQQDMVWDSAIREEETAHPHLVAFKEAIMSDANVNEAIKAFHQKNGRMPSPGKEVVQAARENFQTKLQGYQTALSQQQVASQMQKNALSLSIGGEPTPKGNLTPEQIGALSSDDFARLRAQVLNGA
jgi:hypothetical protein